MKPGKLPENVLKRSVLKSLKSKREEVKVGAAVGADCAILKFENEWETAVSSDVLTLTDKKKGSRIIYKVTNNLVAAKSEPVAVMITFLMPKGFLESDMKDIMLDLEKTCREQNIQIAGGHTEVVDSLLKPLLSVTGIGKRREQPKKNQAKPGQDILVTKWIGMEGTVQLAEEKWEELTKRFSEKFLEGALALEQYFSVIPEAATAGKSDIGAMHDVSGGGIYGALWEMAESSGVGLEIDLKKIPVKQETVEICNFCNINPYELKSGGSLLLTCDCGEQLAEELIRLGIKATVIGKTTGGNDRLIMVEEEKRFLTPPKRDAYHLAD